MIYLLMNAATQQQQEPNPFISFLPFVFLILILYFLMIRPQQKRQKEHQKLLEELKTGDEVITSGGIVGKITNFRKEKDTVIIKVEGDSKLEIKRSFVSGLVQNTQQEIKNEPTK